MERKGRKGTMNLTITNVTAKLYPCDCADHACPVHTGADCRFIGRTTFYRRIDMDGGVRFCPACAEDALESGLFA